MPFPKLIEFLDPVLSRGINLGRAPFQRPGRYGGFDTMEFVGYDEENNKTIIKVVDGYDSIPIPLNPGENPSPCGVLVFPCGVTFIHKAGLDDEKEIPIPANLDSLEPKYYIFYGIYQWQESGPGGVDVDYGLDSMGITTLEDEEIYLWDGPPIKRKSWIGDEVSKWYRFLAENPNDPQPHKDRCPIGIFKVERDPGGPNYNKITYYPAIPPVPGNQVPYEVKPFARKDKENIFPLKQTFGNWEIVGDSIQEIGGEDIQITHEILDVLGRKELKIQVKSTGDSSLWGGISFTYDISEDTCHGTISVDGLTSQATYRMDSPYSFVNRFYVDPGQWIEVGTQGVPFNIGWESYISGKFKPLSYRRTLNHIEIAGAFKKTGHGDQSPVFQVPLNALAPDVTVMDYIGMALSLPGPWVITGPYPFIIHELGHLEFPEQITQGVILFIHALIPVP